MAKSDRIDVDWLAFQAKVADIHAQCIPFKVATKQDIERCRLSDLTYNMIECNLIIEWRSGEIVVILDPDKRERLIGLAETLGFEIDGNFMEDWYRGKTPHRWKRLDQLIKKRIINNELLELWGILNQSYAEYFELYLGNEAVYKREFHQYMMAQGDATLIQRHWYAHWLHEAVTKSSKSIDDARSELVQLIELLASKELKPANPYDAEWFIGMLEIKKQAGRSEPTYTGDLKTSYTKQSWAEIGRLIKHPLITPRVLPPLSAAGFQRA